MTGVALPRPFRLIALDTVDSTNDEAKRLAAAGAADGTVVWARRQTAGRGRRGRRWVSEEGNLYCSVLVRPEYPASEAAQATFVAAIAAADAVAAALPPDAYVTCKWPNDVLVEGRKVAGILLESAAAAGEALDWQVVGLGINLAHFPADAEFPATSLHAEGAPDATEPDLLESFCSRFQAWRVTWRRVGFAAVRRAWLGRAHGLGQPVTVRLERETLGGVFAALDEGGALVLRQDGGERRITAGDVFPAAD